MQWLLKKYIFFAWQSYIFLLLHHSTLFENNTIIIVYTYRMILLKISIQYFFLNINIFWSILFYSTRRHYTKYLKYLYILVISNFLKCFKFFRRIAFLVAQIYYAKYWSTTSTVDQNIKITLVNNLKMITIQKL